MVLHPIPSLPIYRALIIPFKETRLDKELAWIWRTQLRSQTSWSGIPSYMPTYSTIYLYRLPSVYLTVPCTLLGTKISHLAKRNMIFRCALGYFSSQEGTYSNYLLPWMQLAQPAIFWVSWRQVPQSWHLAMQVKHYAIWATWIGLDPWGVLLDSCYTLEVEDPGTWLNKIKQIIPQKWTKLRKFHLPTINFQWICLFSGRLTTWKA